MSLADWDPRVTRAWRAYHRANFGLVWLHLRCPAPRPARVAPTFSTVRALPLRVIGHRDPRRLTATAIGTLVGTGAIWRAP